MVKYNYFLSYTFSNSGKTGFGNIDYYSTKKLKKMEQILELQKKLAIERNFDLCIITNIELLSKDYLWGLLSI